jgi:hypothetical protein
MDIAIAVFDLLATALKRPRYDGTGVTKSNHLRKKESCEDKRRGGKDG